MARAAGARKRQQAVQEDKLLNLIDQAATIRRYEALLRKVGKGTLDVPAFIKEVALDAALKVAHIMHTSNDEKVQLSAATDLLDRAGHGKTTKHQFQGGVTITHDASRMELVNMILTSARRAGIKTKEGREVLLEARNQDVAPEASPPSAEEFVDVVAEHLDDKATPEGAPVSLGGRGRKDTDEP